MPEMPESAFAGIVNGDPGSPGADPVIAFVIFANAKHIIPTDTIGVILLMPEMGEFPCQGIEPVQSAAVRADPKFFFRILDDAQHVVIAETVVVKGMLIMSETAGIPAHYIHASRKSPYPHITIAVPVCRMNGIIAQAGIVYVVMKIIGKMTGDGIVDAKPPVLQADPQIPFFPFAQCIYHIPGDCIDIVCAVSEMAKRE